LDDSGTIAQRILYGQEDTVQEEKNRTCWWCWPWIVVMMVMFALAAGTREVVVRVVGVLKDPGTKVSIFRRMRKMRRMTRMEDEDGEDEEHYEGKESCSTC
jgi:hypothetical protein